MMDEEKMNKMMDELKKLGIDKDMIDDHTMLAAKKITFGIMKLRWMMDEKGVDKAKTKKVIQMLVDKAMEKDLKKMMDKKKDFCHKQG